MAVGFGFSLNRAKTLFFDRQPVIDSLDRAERRVLSRFGAYVRSDARKSIRNRKNHSKPGQPPTNQTGKLKGSILFFYEKDQRGVVIGPFLFPSVRRKDNLVMLEYGGDRTDFTFGRRVRQHYEARPFMRPAFNKNIVRMPEMLRDSMR